MADFTARAETELKLDDDWMEAHFADESAVVDVIRREPIEAFQVPCRTVPATAKGRFQVRGFRIDCSRSDRDAGTAWMNAALLNHQLGQNLLDRYACTIMHPECPRYIYPYQTTARGISVYC